MGAIFLLISYQSILPEKKNVVCLSHSSNLVGKIAETSAALSHSFVGYVASLVSRSAQWRGYFTRRAGTPPLSKSNVRWYSEFEFARQVFQHLGLIEELARDDIAVRGTGDMWGPTGGRRCCSTITLCDVCDATEFACLRIVRVSRI